MPLSDDAAGVRTLRGALALLALLPLVGCVHTVEAQRLKNPTTGEVVSACGPLTGFGDLAARVQQECMKNFEAQGLVEIQH
jgi:hypothetical protein